MVHVLDHVLPRQEKPRGFHSDLSSMSFVRRHVVPTKTLHVIITLNTVFFKIPATYFRCKLYN